MMSIEHSTGAPASNWIQRTGFAGLSLFLLFCWLGTALANIGLGLMLIALLASLPQSWPSIRREPLLAVFLGFCLYLLLRTLWAIEEFPELTSLHTQNALKWLHLWAFLLVAWWLHQYRQHLYPALLVLLTGYVLSVLRLTDWESCRGFLEGTRCGFGFQTIMGGLLAASGLLGLLVFAPKLIGSYRTGIAWFSRLAAWFALTLMTAQMVISTQTRSVWLGLALLLPPLLFARYWHSLRAMLKGENKRGLLLGVLALITVASILLANKNVFDDRLLHVKSSLFTMLTSHFDRVEVGDFSVTGRIFMTKAGIDKWLERPFFGWGTGINAVDFFPDLKEKIGSMTHLHNTYAELLVRLGLVGAGFYVFAVCLIGRGIYRCHRRRLIGNDVFYFLLGAAGLLSIWCVSDYQLLSIDWRFYWLVTFGIAGAFALGQRRIT